MQRFYYKQNRLKQLRAFCYVAQTGSMSRAAERMFLSQPSVSILIQALERDLGDGLLERHGPRIKLSAAGKILLDLALPLVEGIESLPESFNERCNRQVGGNLNIAAGESTTLYLLPAIISRFTAAHPHIQVNLHNIPARDSLDLLRSGNIDLAVGPLQERPEDILYTPLFSYEPVLITPIDHVLADKKRISLQDIEPYKLIMPPKLMTTRRIIDMVFQQHGIDVKIKMEAGGWEVIKRYVALGLGISIVTSICLGENERLARIPLTDYFPKRSYGLALRRDKFISPAARKFIELIAPDALAPYLSKAVNDNPSVRR